MFALVSIDEKPLRITLKCEPNDAQIQRSLYASVKPGYHMNKEHWNTITIDGSIPDRILLQLMDESYDLVIKGLSRKDQELLKIEKRFNT